MKTTKRLIAMAAALTLTACAAAPITMMNASAYDVTITKNSEDTAAHTYEAYQIFTGDLSGETLSNIQWGAGISVEGKTTLGDAAIYAEGLTDSNAAEKADELSRYLTSPSKTGTESITGLDAGYYLFKDAEDSPGTSGSKTKYILKVVKDATITIKSSVPTIVKKVQDKNDTTSSITLSDLQDSADYDIGDTIPYTITATIGSGISNYSAYSLQFVDVMSAGLTMDESSWDIKVGTTSLKTNFTMLKTGNTYTWSINDIKSATTITDGTQVVLTYNVKLNSNAVIGSEGNPNTVKLKFDNNPNSCGNGTPAGETPEDKNIVFTYKTVFNKVDGDGKPLTGADFTLYKKVDGNWVDVTKLNGETTGTINPTKTISSLTIDEITANNASFEFKGLDDGDYKLVESKTPAGYNTISPIEFTITAEHVITSDDPTLTKLMGRDSNGVLTITGLSDAQVNLSSGEVSGNVINTSGSTLPTTGGTGTKVLYAIGGTILVGAGMVLVSKKRAQK